MAKKSFSTKDIQAIATRTSIQVVSMANSIQRVKEDQQEPIGIKEASKLLSLSVRTIYNKTCKGKIPHHRKGRLYFFRDELLDWLRSSGAEQKEVANG